MRCKVPRPQMNSVQLMPTTSRSGNCFARMVSAAPAVHRSSTRARWNEANYGQASTSNVFRWTQAGLNTHI